MKIILSERNLVVLLFIMVLITFSLAQEDSKKMESIYSGVNTKTATVISTELGQIKHISSATILRQ